MSRVLSVAVLQKEALNRFTERTERPAGLFLFFVSGCESELAETAIRSIAAVSERTLCDR